MVASGNVPLSPGKYERFIASYLRLNGYFTVANFIVHAGDDRKRQLSGSVGNHTETDILGIRLPHSFEKTGPLHIGNDIELIGDLSNKIDVIIAEVKSGHEDKPNKVWKNGSIDVIRYIIQFVGCSDDKEINKAVESISSNYRFENGSTRVRYIIFSKKENKHYIGKGVTYMCFDKIISFIVRVRGQSWLTSNLGVASCHSQWDSILIDIFEIANRPSLELEEKERYIYEYLDN